MALGGTSLATVAQSVLPANSVGEVQLRDGAVTSAKVADETLQFVDLSPRARAALGGAAGPAGPAGPQGAQGGPGVSRLEVVQAATANNGSSPKSVKASCRGGRRVLGGGAWASHAVYGSTEAGPIAVRASYPDRREPAGGRNRDGWRAMAIETGSLGVPGNWRLTAYAVCAFVN